MKVVRLSQIAHIHQFWDFFLTGLTIVGSKTNREYNSQELLPVLHYFVKRPELGFIGVCRDSNNEPISFILVRDKTDMFDSAKTAEILAVYYPKRQKATITLMFKALYSWMRNNNYKHLQYNTNKKSSALVRNFKDSLNLNLTKYTFTKTI